MQPPRPLAVVGNVNVDLILGPCAPWPEPGTEAMVEHDDLRVGGAAGNTALAWAALGRPHRIFANVGDDHFGTWLREAFGERSQHWPVETTSTTVSVGITHPNGERTFFTSRGHLPRLSLPSLRAGLDPAALSGGILLLCGSFLTDSLTRDYAELFDWADTHGIDVALDTGWPLDGWTPAIRKAVLTWLPRCRYLLLNEIETVSLTRIDDVEAALASLLPHLKPGGTAVVKCGAEGALALGPSGPMVRRAAPPVAVVDTIGAGDVFNAGFLMGVAAGDSLGDSLSAGVTLASRAVSTSPRRYELGDPA
ncbi:PfkB family carbohydrate kinase [Aurantimonas sp. 22II-16-19i]|uniref:carbohydrate kinase family protein n=1 Tax=Aurantimonas sp. 22II-16-19i TaxID=1317114 RepID=UPI0009F7D6AB|nr:PfkB family carbohydrate kinase [Aurantimonas sp. 22II-16-19i]ORE91267.1 carbohydrate kinase [Aurantimonas sp. 22II-16-19i]